MSNNRSSAVDFNAGSTVRFVVSNKPYVDFSVPPDLNDYRDAEFTNIKIYDPKNKLLVDQQMYKILNRPGWYMFDFCTKCESCFGVYKAIITLSSDLSHLNDGNTIATSGTTGTTGTSGTCESDGNVCSDTSIGYFRLLDPRNI
jgi:hypothetical protein